MLSSDEASPEADGSEPEAAPPEAAEADLKHLGDEELQRLLVAAIGTYVDRVQANPALSPFPPDQALTATQVMVAASALIDAAGLQVFELGLWQSWSTSS